MLLLQGPSPRGRGKPRTRATARGERGTIPAWAGETRRRPSAPRRAGDHPRVGGGNLISRTCVADTRGPSPRGRGKHDRQRLAGGGTGTIPAWAGETRRRHRHHPAPRDHPRVGGGNALAELTHLTRTGPSPRGRGKRQLAGDVARPKGTIPAWAGETPGDHRFFGEVRDHPRVGGGNRSRAAPKPSRTGPSPRGRGKRRLNAGGDAVEGTIPAWAGETCAPVSPCRHCGDHPRVGGGNRLGPRDGLAPEGPSPRGRGKQLDLSGPKARIGTIPAWAGETSAVSAAARAAADHPRVGGGNPNVSPSSSLLKGPSPRGRGKRSRFRAGGAWDGTIPAWAGETSPRSSMIRTTRDHPRVGGGNPDLSSALKLLAGPSPRGRGKPQSRQTRRTIAGPSPRGRGKLRDAGRGALDQGTIPAWAGETTSRTRSRSARRDHPRVGGGNGTIARNCEADWGPSPRGRGKRACGCRRRRRSGTIPAWAGETTGQGATNSAVGDHPRVGGGNR